jgi:hypothetical protein
MVKVECTKEEVARKRQKHDEDKESQEEEIKKQKKEAVKHPNNPDNVKEFG